MKRDYPDEDDQQLIELPLASRAPNDKKNYTPQMNHLDGYS